MKQRRQLCTFYLQKLLFGVEVEKVQEVIRYQEMTRVPLVPEVVRGLINLRGQIVTAVDLRRRLGMSERPADQLPLNVVARTDDGPVSLLVDEIGDVLEVSDEAYERAPENMSPEQKQMVEGVYKLEHRLLLVLNVHRALEVGADPR